MKPSLLIPALALLGPVAFAADPDPKPLKPDTNPNATVSGKATITIDVNGKKETREIDLGTAVPLKIASGEITIKTEPAQVRPPARQRTWLGVATDEPTDDVRAQLPIPEGTGLLVRGVVAESPAAKAGLEKNDVLVRLDDQILANPDQLRKLVGMKKEGDAVHLTYLRKGHEAVTEIKLGSHAEEDAAGGLWNLGKLIGDGVIGEVQSALKPLVLQSTVTLDKDGQFVTSRSSAGGDKGEAKAAGQWSLSTGGARADVTEQLKQLDKALRDAGLSNEAIAQAEKAVADAVAQVQKALANAGADKGNIQRQLQKAVEDAKQAVDQARRSAEEAAARKANPAPSVPPAPAASPAQKAP